MNTNIQQLNNIRALYIGAFQRLVTMFSLINSGGIIAIITYIASNGGNNNICM